MSGKKKKEHRDGHAETMYTNSDYLTQDTLEIIECMIRLNETKKSRTKKSSMKDKKIDRYKGVVNMIIRVTIQIISGVTNKQEMADHTLTTLRGELRKTNNIRLVSKERKYRTKKENRKRQTRKSRTRVTTSTDLTKPR